MTSIMAEESIKLLIKRIIELKEIIDFVEAICIIERRKADSHYLTDLANNKVQLQMIKSAVDALISKIPEPSDQTQMREQSGRENRDSGLPSVDSALLRSRDSSVLEDKGLHTLTLEETNESPTASQCPHCQTPVINLPKETFQENMEKGACENDDTESVRSDEEHIETTITSL